MIFFAFLRALQVYLLASFPYGSTPLVGWTDSGVSIARNLALISSLFNIIVKDYIEYFKGIKEINNNIIFVGGLSKCNYLITEFTKVLNKNIMVDKNSSYVTALGAAIYAKNNKKQVSFDLNTKNTAMKTKIEICNKCPVNCEIVSMYIGDELVDSFGYNCEKGKINIGKSNYDKSKVN